MHVQRNNPIGPDMMYLHLKGPTPWGSDAHIEDQSFRDTMHVQWANPTHTCTCVHGRALCHVGRTIYMGNSACTERSLY